MSSLTIYLYSAAVAVICALIAFSKNNRKNGWKKTRVTLAGAMEDLYGEIGRGTELNRPAAATVYVNTMEFTSQLVRLRGALGSSNPITTNPVTTQSEAFGSR